MCLYLVHFVILVFLFLVVKGYVRYQFTVIIYGDMGAQTMCWNNVPPNTTNNVPPNTTNREPLNIKRIIVYFLVFLYSFVKQSTAKCHPKSEYSFIVWNRNVVIRKPVEMNGLS